jgi:hypothetical protein
MKNPSLKTAVVVGGVLVGVGLALWIGHLGLRLMRISAALDRM